jgi:hypothetical protein
LPAPYRINKRQRRAIQLPRQRAEVKGELARRPGAVLGLLQLQFAHLDAGNERRNLGLRRDDLLRKRLLGLRVRLRPVVRVAELLHELAQL